MAPLVCLIAAATPELPLPPVPLGHCTALSAPTLELHSELSCESHDVNTNDVPDSSERCTVAMGRFGMVTPGFRALIAGSSQFAMWPRNMFATVGPSNFSPLFSPGTLYATDTAPSTTGSSTGCDPLGNADMSLGCSGASESAKSTVFCCRSVMPPPEPMA